jgi:TetR/AcrR family transcriptional repressor of nem operon
MPKDGNQTKYRILNETNMLVFENGFAGTTIDHILERTEITKGAFFYHFKSKADLAMALMVDFSKRDLLELDRALGETEQYASDPRERLMRFVQHFIDMMAKLEEPYPGCLYASYVNEPQQFSQEIRDIVSESILAWRQAIINLLEDTAKAHPMRMPAEVKSLADHFTVILEGAYIVSKALNDPGLTARQLIHYRNYLEQLFGYTAR